MKSRNLPLASSLGFLLLLLPSLLLAWMPVSGSKVKLISSSGICPAGSVCVTPDGTLIIGEGTCPSDSCMDGDLSINGAVVNNYPITNTGVEYLVWSAKDSNGDIVAECRVVCSVLTDGSQVCQIKYYVMSDTPGTLTNELTIDVNSD